LAAYLSSGHFGSAVFENWESEFLQMAAFVVLTAFLIQKGSSELKDPDKINHEMNRRMSDATSRTLLSRSIVEAYC